MAQRLLLTILLEENARQFFTALRKIYLPSSPSGLITPLLSVEADPLAIEEWQQLLSQHPPFTISIPAPVVKDNEIYYPLPSAQLRDWQQQLRHTFSAYPCETIEPRIVLQEDADIEEKAELELLLKQQFSSFSCQVNGCALWEVSSDKWTCLREIRFGA